MAWLFDDASTNYITYAGEMVGDYPFTIGLWFRTNDDTIDQYLWCEVNVTTDTVALHLGQAADAVRFTCEVGGGSGTATASASFTANTWHHACGVAENSTSRLVYLDGGNVGTNATSVTISGMDATKTEFGRRNGASIPEAYFSGDMAEAGLWNVALTAAEVASLGKGASPLMVRPQSLVGYWPMLGLSSTELDRWKNRLDMTVNGAAKSAHPRITYPH